MFFDYPEGWKEVVKLVEDFEKLGSNLPFNPDSPISINLYSARKLKMRPAFSLSKLNCLATSGK